MGKTGPYLTSVIVLGFFRHSFSVVLTNPINPEGKVPFDLIRMTLTRTYRHVTE